MSATLDMRKLAYLLLGVALHKTAEQAELCLHWQPSSAAVSSPW